MKKYHKERLIKLRDFLRTLPKGFYKQDIFGDLDANNHAHERANLDCGTPACALGWCTNIFPRYFKFVPEKRINLYDKEYYRFDLLYKNKDTEDEIFSNYDYIAQKFFGIDEEFWAMELFGPQEKNRTPKQEADLIDKYIKYAEAK